jgi:hypothetical protein
VLSNSLGIRVAQHKKRINSLCPEVSFSLSVLMLAATRSLVLVLELSDLTSIPAAEEGHSPPILDLHRRQSALVLLHKYVHVAEGLIISA